jgi:hypothetical protein
MKKEYKLINPVVSGSLKTVYHTSSAKKAAFRAYKDLSKYFSNDCKLPVFFFTIQSGGSLYHFKAKEKKIKEGVSFEISPYRDVPEEKEKALWRTIHTKQRGGGDSFEDIFGDEDDSSSSSSSSSDEEDIFGPKNISRIRPIPITTDITGFWYTPIIYPAAAKYFYAPVFNNSIIAPLVKFELELSRLV